MPGEPHRILRSTESAVHGKAGSGAIGWPDPVSLFGRYGPSSFCGGVSTLFAPTGIRGWAAQDFGYLCGRTTKLLQ